MLGKNLVLELCKNALNQSDCKNFRGKFPQIFVGSSLKNEYSFLKTRCGKSYISSKSYITFKVGFDDLLETQTILLTRLILRSSLNQTAEFLKGTFPEMFLKISENTFSSSFPNVAWKLN